MNTPDTRTSPRVLQIVEDQLLLAVALQDALEDAGYRVLDIATRHREAIGVALRGMPDLALVDIELAQGDNGVALAGELKALGIPVLFISGHAGRSKLARAMAVGSLPKPYCMPEMVAAVDYLLRHASGDESRPRPARLEVFDAVRPDWPAAA